ncbi:uncharacterized protein [Procambarus clarkii]|uniref:uncharacterized protein isoform X1 n=1 Tax=Procambarus clarkii TaxID=6728 RepID=UPI00374299AE
MSVEQQQTAATELRCSKRDVFSSAHEPEEVVDSMVPWISQLTQNIESSGSQIYEAGLDLCGFMTSQGMEGEKAAPEYVVAKFVDSNTFSVIHKTWLEIKGNRAYSYWPSSHAALKAQTKEAPDKERWRRHKIHAISFEMNWEKALRRLKKLEVLQSDGLANKGTRRVKRKRRYISESESETDDGEGKTLRAPLTERRSKENKCVKLLPKLPSLGVFQPPPPHLSAIDRLNEEFKTRVLAKLESIITNQRDQLSLLKEIAGLQRMHVEDELIEDLIPKPLNSKLDLLELSRVLQKDATFRKELLALLISLGSHRYSLTVHGMLEKLGTDKLWSQYNLKGEKNKYSIQKLAVYKVILSMFV